MHVFGEVNALLATFHFWCMAAGQNGILLGVAAIRCGARLTSRFSGKGSFKGGNVEFFHAKHGTHRPRRLRLVGITHHIGQGRREYLPGDPELVLEPTALLDFATRREALPVMVDPFLGLAWNLEGDRLVELEMRAAIQRRKALALDLELHGHHRPFGTAVDFEAFLPITADPADPAIPEDGDIKTRCLLGFAVEPEAGGDLLGNHHFLLPIPASARANCAGW